MADLEKVKKFLEVSGVEQTAALMNKHSLAMLEELFPQDTLDDLKEEHPNVYSEIITERDNSRKTMQKQIMEKSLSLIIEFFSHNFSDEEIDKFIDFYSSPIWTRLLRLMPEYAQKAMSVCLPIIQEERERLEKKLDELLDKILTD
jgi:hypothetical protein